MDSAMSITTYRPLSLLVIWHDAPDSPIQVFFVNKKNVSQSMVHIIPASEGCFTSSANQTFLFLHSFLSSLVNEHSTTSSSSPSTALSTFSIFYDGHAPSNFLFLFSYFSVFLLLSSFSFLFSGHLLLPGLWSYLPHFLHRCLYCLLYAPKAFSFSTFSSFSFFFVPMIQFFANCIDC